MFNILCEMRVQTEKRVKMQHTKVSVEQLTRHTLNVRHIGDLAELA